MNVRTCLMKDARSLNCFVLGDHILRLGRRRSARLSRSGGRFGGKDIFFKKALVDELFQVFLEAPVLDGFVPFTIMI